MKRFAAYIAALIAAVSCIYPYTPDLGEENEIRLVIDGDIVLGGLSTFTFSSTMPLNSMLPNSGRYPEVKAALWIEDDKGVEYPKGLNHSKLEYETKATIDMSDASSDRQYRIHCKVKNLGEKHDLEYVSEWESFVESPKVTSVDYSYDNKSVFVNLSVEGGATYSKWDYTELWQYKADYIATLIFNERTRQVEDGEPEYAHSTCWKSESAKLFGLGTYQNQSSDALLNQRLCQIPRNDKRLSFADKFSVSVCGLSESAYQYLQNLLTISTLTGSLFAPSPEDMRGNISNVSDPDEFVIGYVSVVKPTLYTYYLIPDKDVYTPDKLPELFVPNIRQYDLVTWYRRGFVPVMEDTVNEGGTESTQVLWGEKRCVDCTQLGGTIVKPEDWPL
ncbi:MAG: DUF4249 domain-containing protein [Bacteroidales bacterium]|nr:DUF4249 domain-containing protein [Bacteroidales bacterium]